MGRLEQASIAVTMRQQMADGTRIDARQKIKILCFVFISSQHKICRDCYNRAGQRQKAVLLLVPGAAVVPAVREGGLRPAGAGIGSLAVGRPQYTGIA